MHLAVKHNHIDIIGTLMKEATVDLNIGKGYPSGTVLHCAVERLQPTLVSMFLSQGANPNCVDKEGNTPLHLLMAVYSKD